MKTDFRSVTRVIHRDTWAPTETVTIRKFYGDADRRRVLSCASEYHQDENGRTVIVGTLDKLHTTKRVLAIKSWTLLDEDSQPLPMTPDIIANLPPDDAAFIDDCIDEEWSNLGTPVSSKEEAERLAKEEKEENQTFRGSSQTDAPGSQDRPPEANAAPAGDSGRGRAVVAAAHTDAGLRGPLA